MQKVIESHFIKTSNYGVICLTINLNQKWYNYDVYTRLVESGANGGFVEALYLQIWSDGDIDDFFDGSSNCLKAEQYFHFDNSGECPLNAAMPSKNYKIFDKIHKDQIYIYLVPLRLLYGDDWANKYKR
jgi:hypothetical protein